MLRGYTIGWGRGVPDVYSKILDNKQLEYTIDGLGTYNLTHCFVFLYRQYFLRESSMTWLLSGSDQDHETANLSCGDVSTAQSYMLSLSIEPNTEYVISLRAFNNVGDGQPVYEQVRTKPREESVPATLSTPIGLKAVVLTPFTVALQWTDTTLNRNQVKTYTFLILIFRYNP